MDKLTELNNVILQINKEHTVHEQNCTQLMAELEERIEHAKELEAKAEATVKKANLDALQSTIKIQKAISAEQERLQAANIIEQKQWKDNLEFNMQRELRIAKAELTRDAEILLNEQKANIKIDRDSLDEEIVRVNHELCSMKRNLKNGLAMEYEEEVIKIEADIKDMLKTVSGLLEIADTLDAEIEKLIHPAKLALFNKVKARQLSPYLFNMLKAKE